MKLAEYLKKKRLTASEFSRMIEVSPVAMHRYLAGRIPHADTVCVIHKVTRGAVQPNDFYAIGSKR